MEEVNWISLDLKGICSICPPIHMNTNGHNLLYIINYFVIIIIANFLDLVSLIRMFEYFRITFKKSAKKIFNAIMFHGKLPQYNFGKCNYSSYINRNKILCRI